MSRRRSKSTKEGDVALGFPETLLLVTPLLRWYDLLAISRRGGKEPPWIWHCSGRGVTEERGRSPSSLPPSPGRCSALAMW